jgi:hypothetical protein
VLGRNYDTKIKVVKNSAEDLNNLDFGVVARAFGLFPEKLMLVKAGEAEMQN